MTDEEIAEAFEAVVCCFSVDDHCRAVADHEALQDTLRQFASKAREEGAREATAVNLPGAPMSEEELEQTIAAVRHDRVVLGTSSRIETANALDLVDVLLLKLVPQVRWLQQCLRDVANGDSWGEGYRAGYEAAEGKGVVK